jgi:23S rRNA pseudouridine1911/1915/1917 synthase
MIEVLYEDNHLIAVNKRSSDLSQGDSSGDTPLDDQVKDYISEKYGKPGRAFLGIVHRLDRPVGGVILYARTSKALKRLNELFQKREVRKIYVAIVKERPPKDEDTVVHFLKKNEQQNKSYAYDNEIKGSKRASLTYRIAGRSDKYYLLEIELHSGRHHQIRAQLSRIGCPVKGDLKYGYPRSNDDGSISLFARMLEFTHPVRQTKLTIRAPLPGSDVWKLFGSNPEIT